MFLADLYRRNEHQDTVEVTVMKASDEIYLKRNGIRVIIDDQTFQIVLVATDAFGRTIEVVKGLNQTIASAFADLVRACKKVALQ